MVLWEYGNALYLNQKKGARFVSPQFFEQAFRQYFNDPKQVVVSFERESNLGLI
jgi:hypothetical protein